MLSKHKLKLTGKGIIIPESEEWIEDNVKVISQGGVFYEVVDTNPESEDQKFGWFVPSELHITSDFTLHTANGMRGESFTDNLKEILIIDQHSRLAEFITGELVDVDITEYLDTFDNFLGSNFNIGNRYKDMEHNHDDGVIFLSPKSEKIIIQTSENSVRIGNQSIFVLDREEESLVLLSDENGITVIQDGKSVVEINEDKGVRLDGKEFDPLKIVSHITESLHDAFSDLDF